MRARKLLGWRKRRKAEAIRAAKEAGKLSQGQPSGRGMLDLDFVRDDVKSFLDKEGVGAKPVIGIFEHVGEFSSRSLYAISLILREKEIILFAALQWIVIALLYYLWVQMLGWIPMEVWRSESKIYAFGLNLAFLAWSFLCVTLAAYPIGLFTGCMGAAHFLREQGYPSTIAACLKIALPNAGRLWAFATVDGWITVDQVVERLPKKRGNPTPAQRAISEALYYAWKVGTIGVVPALLTGKDLMEAGKESVSLVKHKLKDVLALRGGYSAVCWIIGIAGYIGGILFSFQFPVFEGKHPLFTFYLWMGIPLLVAVGAVKLFARPIFVIASFKLYSDYLKERNEKVNFDGLPGRAVSSFVVFLVLCLITFVVYLFRDEVGLMRILRVGTFWF